MTSPPRTAFDLGYAADLLASAEHALLRGAHVASLVRIEDAAKLVNGAWPDSWAMTALLQEARNRFLLGQYDDVRECLARLHDPQGGSVLIQNEAMGLQAMMLRRDAHALWKARDVRKAKEVALMAFERFEMARDLAHGAGQRHLELRHELNRLYTNGLIAVMSNTMTQSGPALVLAAILVEAESHQWTPPALADHASGLTIVADLARGAGLSVADVLKLERNERFVSAFRIILSDDFEDPPTWAELLLVSCRTQEYRPSSKWKAFELGAMFLLSSPDVDAELARAYQTRLMDVVLHKEAHTPNKALQLRRLIQQLDEFCTTPFKGRRAFR